MKQISKTLGLVGPRLRRGLQGGAALGMLAAVGACDTQRLVSVQDPDIIAPEFVTSAAAADALRLGILGRFNAATTGGEGMFLYSGMLTDEFESGDTFIERNQMDLRSVQIENANLDGGYRSIQRVRVGAQQARKALVDYDLNGPAWKKAEMFAVEAYAINLIAEHFCSGVPFSTVVDGIEQPGGPRATAAMYGEALAKYDSALTLLGTATDAESGRVRNIVRVEKGRTLMNLNRPADAAASVAAVPTTFGAIGATAPSMAVQEHSASVRDNAVWSLNIAGRRYLVGNSESGEGLNFFSAADPRLPTCLGGDVACRAKGITNTAAFNNAPGLRVQLLWDERTDPVSLINGVQARLIGAEAALRGSTPAAAIDSLNALRRAMPATASLPALVDPGTQTGRVDLLFRERAFWNYGLGMRLGDLRRLVRQYGRTQESVFPSGAYAATAGLSYGSDVNFPIPQSERNNPEYGQAGACIDRNA